MEIVNAAPSVNHKEHNACGCQDTVKNPAINHGDFSEVEDDLHAAQRAKHKPSEVPEISVNGIKITEQSVLAEMQYHPASTKRQSMVKAVECLIIGELVQQRAAELTAENDDLAIDNKTDDELVHQLINIEHPTPQASEQECHHFYLQNKAKFTTSPLLEVRHILLAVSPDDINERIRLKDVAQEMIETLAKTPSRFEELVLRHSSCPSKATKGHLGQISQGQTVPEFEQHVFKAKPGLMKHPVETRYGFHIVCVERKIDGAELPFEYVQEKIKDYLNEKVQRKNIAQYIQQLVQVADIKGFNFDFDNSPLVQ